MRVLVCFRMRIRTTADAIHRESYQCLCNSSSGHGYNMKSSCSFTVWHKLFFHLFFSLPVRILILLFSNAVGLFFITLHSIHIYIKMAVVLVFFSYTVWKFSHIVKCNMTCIDKYIGNQDMRSHTHTHAHT